VEKILDLAKEGSTLTIALTALLVIGASLKLLKGAFDFHYDYFTRRQLKRALELIKDTEPESPLHLFLKELIYSEKFKVVTGIRTDTKRATALMTLCANGILPAHEIQKIHKYVKTNLEDSIQIQIPLFDRFFAIFSIVSALTTLGYGALISIILTTTNSPAAMAAGFGILLGTTVASALMASDFRKVKIAKRVQRNLANKTITAGSCYRVKGGQI